MKWAKTLIPITEQRAGYHLRGKTPAQVVGQGITMQYVSGTILDPGTHPFEGYICWDGGIIMEVGKGTPPGEPQARGIITPLFINGHTHIGDSCFSDRIDIGIGLENIVNPPAGLKHRLLRSTPRDELLRGMRRSMKKMMRTGTMGFVDFREGGIPGVELLEQAHSCYQSDREPHTNTNPATNPDVGMQGDIQIQEATPYVFSRPASLSYDHEEIAQLLKHSVGIGISAMMDWEYSELEKIAKQVKAAGKLFAMHASETVREDIDMILDLKPDILVHLTSASSSDLELVADEAIEVVICPRTNSLFGFLPDIQLMLKHGISLSLGTDNLMFTEPNMFQEMEFARNLLRNTKNSNDSGEGTNYSAEVLKMSGYRMRKALNVKSGLSLDTKACFMVLQKSGTEPESAARSIIRNGRISLIVDGNSQWEVI